MKTYKYICIILVAILTTEISTAQDIKAKEIVKRSNDLFLGKSSISTMTMTIKRPGWNRSVSMQSWSMGNDYYIIYILSPARDKGQVFLKRKNNMWNWVPRIKRMVKIPPSMMMQSWMGSDFTNDDVVRANSIVNDYSHRIIGLDQIEGLDCYKIEFIPLEDAPVVWGKIIMWIAKEKYFQLKAKYYDDDMALINISTASDIKKFGNKELPTLLRIHPVNKPEHLTELKIEFQQFDIPYIKESFFSQQNIKRIRPRKK